MGLAESQPLVHLVPETAICGAFTGQTSQRGVARFLAGVADRAAAPLQRLGEADLLEVAGWQLAGPGHPSARNAVGLLITTAYRAVNLAETWPRK